jgi:hypothetical protein
MVTRLEMDTCVIGKDGTKRAGRKWGLGKEIWGLLGFVAFMCVRMFFQC